MYTQTVQYLTPPTFSGVMLPSLVRAERVVVDPDNPIYRRAHEVFNQRQYMYPSPPVFLGTQEIIPPEEPVFVLRMVIATPNQPTPALPVELRWAAPFVWACLDYQASAFPAPKDRFYYLTVRSGPIQQNNDDTFHVDGFQGVLIPRHLPEQSYIWVDRDPTLFAVQPFFTEDLDPAKHNVHSFFDRHVCRENVMSGVEKGVYLFDPYHVHARPKTTGARRTMLRLSCLTTEIRDDTNTPNPVIRMGPYNKADPRNHLWDYPVADPEAKFGLRKADQWMHGSKI